MTISVGSGHRRDQAFRREGCCGGAAEAGAGAGSWQCRDAQVAILNSLRLFLNRWGGGTAASDVSSLLNFSLRGQVSSCGEQRQELVGEALAALLEVDEGDGDRMMVGKGR